MLIFVLVLVLLLPIYKLWTLHMPLNRRLSVIFIFLLGGLVSLVGIIRIHFLTQIYSVLTPASQHKRIASVAGADTTCKLFLISKFGCGPLMAGWHEFFRDICAGILLDHHRDKCRYLVCMPPHSPTYSRARRKLDQEPSLDIKQQYLIVKSQIEWY